MSSEEYNLKNTTTADNEDKESIKSRAGCENTKPDVVVLTECPTDPCSIYYTDTWSQSLLIVCRNSKHTIDMEKKVNGVNGRQPNSDANLFLTDIPSHNSPSPLSQRNSKDG